MVILGKVKCSQTRHKMSHIVGKRKGIGERGRGQGGREGARNHTVKIS